MVLAHLFPVFFLLLMGGLLKRQGITNEIFLKTTDRLIYFIFFPLLLFWKIGAADPQFTAATVRFYLAVAISVIILFLVSLAAIRMGRIPVFQAGAFSQSCYRFNTYVGMAVVASALGEAGVTQFGVLVGIVIPMINVLAVSSLIWFSGRKQTDTGRGVFMLKAIVSNPLILGCAGGLIYARAFDGFPVFIDNTLRLSAAVTLPLALLSIGGALTLKNLKHHAGTAATAAILKLAVLPLTGLGIMTLLGVDGLLFQVGMIFFALPTSTALYVLSAQLNSDLELASASIALSTLLSWISLAVVLVCLNGQMT